MTAQEAGSQETDLEPANIIKKIFKSTQKESLLIIALLFLLVAAFEFLPAVKEARSFVSLKNYENHAASCLTLLADRPWYGRFNHWVFAWIMLVPALVFSISPNSPTWLRAARTIFAAAVCYGLINLSVHLQWDIRNAPFHQDPYAPPSASGWRMDCVNVAGDGFSYVLALVLGWIPACFYTVICLRLWSYCHIKFSKKIVEDYKSDMAGRFFYFCFKIHSIALLILLIAMPIQHFLNLELLNSPLIGMVSNVILRPLLIPFEIFWY